MSTKRPVVRTIARVLPLAILAAAVLPAVAHSPGAARQPTAPQGQSPATAKPSGGQQDGIEVHGHWTIDVRNPDGTLASHHEFENALVSSGAGALAALLGRFSAMGEWLIVLESRGDGPCQFSDTFPTSCFIWERPGLSSPNFSTLIRTLGSPAVTLEFSGNATASRSSTINNVSTRYSMCSPNTSPVACSDLSLQLFDFTVRDGLSIDVVPGQIVQVKVVFSFS